MGDKAEKIEFDQIIRTFMIHEGNLPSKWWVSPKIRRGMTDQSGA